MTTQRPYTGSTKKLVVAFDVGTTYSGVSYSLLEPKAVPPIRGITRFPAQEHVGGDSKTPSIIYYDKTGSQVQAVGAEANLPVREEAALEQGWKKVEWFKLHLRPKALVGPSDPVPQLPPKKSIVAVFADYFGYLLYCLKTYISDVHANGAQLWNAVHAAGIEYVLTHPNGWQGQQQSQMRDAAVMAGLVPNTVEGRERIHFVTEGEASLHFCLENSLTSQATLESDGIAIIDAGGGTIDISAYRRRPDGSKGAPVRFEEITAPRCYFQGSIFVTSRLREHLENYLKGTRWVEEIPTMVRHFDQSGKLTFRNINDVTYLKFGSMKDRDVKYNIRAGKMPLVGNDVAAFFEPSVQCVIKAIREINEASRISSIFLVGGFGANDWFFSRLKESFNSLGISFCRPDAHINKAVTDGAINYYLNYVVSARVARETYGIEVSKTFDPKNQDHLRRRARNLVQQSATGTILVPKFFSVILPKGHKVEADSEFRKSYFREHKDPNQLCEVLVELLCYRGTSETPEWLDVEPEKYNILCTVKANTAHLSKRNKQKNGIYRIEFDIIVSFGLTEIKAQLSWVENGKEKRTPAAVVYSGK
ncbi:hypothetical protein AX16_003239 [Volvariella volvacea WC 439]|nr:hypothetical protein AX16_003239 [Volvariella volvacea WC 439]